MSVLDNIKTKLKAVEDSGRKIENLTSADPEYRYIKDARIEVDGKKLNTEEKFALAGYPRASKNRDLAAYITNAIKEYRKNGGDFNIDYKDLPFIAEVRSYVNHHNANHAAQLTVEDCLRNFGAHEISKIYKRYGAIMQVEHFADANGYVDNYRKNAQYYGYISKASQSLNMIDAYVVGLIGNQNLKESYIDADYIKLVSDKMDAFIRSNQIKEGRADLTMLHKLDPALYQQVTWIAKNFCSLTGEDLSRREVLYTLGLTENQASADLHEHKKSEEFNDCIAQLRDVASTNGKKLSRKDMTDKQYKIIKQKAQRLGVYVNELFRIYEIEYVGGIKKERFSKTKVTQLPYLEDMREERDNSYLAYLNANPKVPREIKFENYFKICTEVYDKYRSKILEKGLICESEYE